MRRHSRQTEAPGTEGSVLDKITYSLLTKLVLEWRRGFKIVTCDYYYFFLAK